MFNETERVVLLDDAGTCIGAEHKARVHHERTPLHLAFSCYLFSPDRTQVLITQRAMTKQTWPGVWTNSFCGHPQPFEKIPDAVHRRAAFELGTQITDLQLALPEFRYRAVDASGVVENEICPVYTAIALTDPVLNPTEVMAARWVPAETLAETVLSSPAQFSPWMVLQLQHLAEQAMFTPELEMQS